MKYFAIYDVCFHDVISSTDLDGVMLLGIVLDVVVHAVNMVGSRLYA